jgi:hypothetical protein
VDCLCWHLRTLLLVLDLCQDLCSKERIVRKASVSELSTGSLGICAMMSVEVKFEFKIRKMNRL